MILSPLLHKTELGHDEGRNKFALVCHNSHLVNKLIHQEQRLYHLRSDILAIGSLEEVLDTVGKEQLAILDIASITRAEESVLGECLLVNGIALVISRCDSWAFEQNLVILINLHFQSVYGSAHRTDSIRHILAGARHSGKTLGQAISHNHDYTYRMSETLNRWRHRCSSCREQMGILQTYLLAHKTKNHLVHELIFHSEQWRRTLAATLAVDVVASTHLESMTEQTLLHGT